MTAIAFRPDCASRTNKRCGAMKTKLHLKFFSGPIGLLLTSRETLAFNSDTVVEQILSALKMQCLETKREDLVLKLRRFCEDGPIADGIFVTDEVLGYFVYAPPELGRNEIEMVMRDCLNLVPFYLTIRDGDLSRILSGPVLPQYPEMPPPITVTWSEAEGEALIAHGR
jgi:hypothetical protein